MQHIKTAYGQIAVKVWQDTHTLSTLAPVVLLHDSLGCIQLWRQFPGLLAQATRRRVIAYDRAGFGHSAPRNGYIGDDFIEAEAQTVFAELLKAKEIDQFIVMGHSVGGEMAVNVAAAYPERCVGLITESAQSVLEPITRAGILEAQQLFADPEQFKRLARYHGEKTAWVLSAWIDTWLGAAFDNWSLDPVLPSVKCPTLVIHGELDEYGTTAQAKRIADGVSGPAQLELMPQIHHVPHREAEQQVLSMLSNFMANLA